MAHSFKSSSGRSTFGTFKEPADAGDYILNKKAKAMYCTPNICTSNSNVGSESNLLILKKANYLAFYACRNNVNWSNLNINLITKLNLDNVPVIENMSFESPTTINTLNETTDPYLYYTIDPSGNLFGNTICGENNYVNYQEYNSPYTTSNAGYINSL
jgi:hypothetical protein